MTHRAFNDSFKNPFAGQSIEKMIDERKGSTTAPHELAAAVNLIQDAGLLTPTYDYKYWLKQVRNCQFAHPEEEVGKLLKKMRDLAAWMRKERGEELSRGAWLTNRLRELRALEKSAA